MCKGRGPSNYSPWVVDQPICPFWKVVHRNVPRVAVLPEAAIAKTF